LQNKSFNSFITPDFFPVIISNLFDSTTHNIIIWYILIYVNISILLYFYATKKHLQTIFEILILFKNAFIK